MNGSFVLLDLTLPALALAFFLVAGFVTVIPTAIDLYNGLKSQSWPCIACVILSANIEEVKTSAQGRYQIQVTYHYRVDGVDYIDDRLRFGYSGHSDIDEARRTVLRFPRGTKARVYINPKRPHQSVLERGLDTGGVWDDIAQGIFCFLSGLAVLVLLIRP